MLNKLGKLLKYEFRYYARLLPPLYLLLAILPLPAGFMIRQSGAPGVLMTTIWGIVITTLIVMNIVLILQHFRDNLLRNTGSLMLTLPVTTWALIASKAIAALITVLISLIVISVSGIVFAMANVGWTDFFADATFEVSAGPLITGLLVGIIMILQQVCLVYASITASHILPKFRFVAGAVLYFAIMYFVEVPVFRLVSFIQKPELNDVLTSSGLVKLMIPYGLAGLALGVFFYWASGFLLKRTINLE